MRAFWGWLLQSTYAAIGASVGFAVGLAALGLAVFGIFGRSTASSTAQLLALAGLGVLLLTRLFARLQRSRSTRRRAALLADLELGTLFVAAAFVVIEITGGPSGLLYPVVYALVAFLVAFHSPGVSAYFLVLILGSEAAINLLQPTVGGWRLFASHTSFNLLFALLYALFLRTEASHRRRSMERELKDHLAAIDAEAQEFRLTSGLSLEGRDLSPELLATRRRIGSLRAIHEALYNVLAVAERALAPHTVALLWLDDDERTLRVKELRSQSDHVKEKPIAAGEGFVGAVTKRKEPLVLTNIKPGHSGLVYYEKPEAVTEFAAVPVLESGHLRGILLADRVGGQPFDEGDLAVMTTISEEIVRAVQVERIFTDMDREKYQKERFYEASREFNRALNLAEVAQCAIIAARRVAQVEFAAVAVATETEGRLSLAAVDWSARSDTALWLHKEFGADEGLVGAAIKARHPLPHGTSRSPSQSVFGPGIDLSLPAVKVMPLLWQDTGVGALVLASDKADFLSLDVLDMLKVIADHAAIAVANAQMFERMERMATTDGLTGLTNHRHFQELFDTVIARAERYGRRLSLIITDIDHFKSVNDTYGHPVGDKVLRRVAGVLANTARRTDIVARYGGEEFAILMEETDKVGAFHIAERIRKAVAAESFHCENGSFGSTLSLGIATFPEDAKSKSQLTECADQSLYFAKRNGRNRTVSWEMLRSGAAQAAGGVQA